MVDNDKRVALGLHVADGEHAGHALPKRGHLEQPVVRAVTVAAGDVLPQPCALLPVAVLFATHHALHQRKASGALDQLRQKIHCQLVDRGLRHLAQDWQQFVKRPLVVSHREDARGSELGEQLVGDGIRTCAVAHTPLEPRSEVDEDFEPLRLLPALRKMQETIDRNSMPQQQLERRMPFERVDSASGKDQPFSPIQNHHLCSRYGTNVDGICGHRRLGASQVLERTGHRW
mmetsp:Transcript_84922/g.254579  ORF Transcript_84922/g.254579 Transcript_84922/m.254579 type:complete len:231 (+) Transcript_84922:432-1124(+)